MKHWETNLIQPKPSEVLIFYLVMLFIIKPERKVLTKLQFYSSLQHIIILFFCWNSVNTTEKNVKITTKSQNIYTSKHLRDDSSTAVERLWRHIITRQLIRVAWLFKSYLQIIRNRQIKFALWVQNRLSLNVIFTISYFFS